MESLEDEEDMGSPLSFVCTRSGSQEGPTTPWWLGMPPNHAWLAMGGSDRSEDFGSWKWWIYAKG